MEEHIPYYREDLPEFVKKGFEAGLRFKHKWWKFLKNPEYKMDDEVRAKVLAILVMKSFSVLKRSMKAFYALKYGKKRYSKQVIDGLRVYLKDLLRFVELILEKW